MQPCTEWLEPINAALDGEAGPAQAAALRAHLAQCPACAALYDDLKALREGSDVLLVRAPESFKANVMAAVAAETSGTVSPVAQVKKSSVTRLRSWAAMAAIFALVVGLGVRQLLPSPSSSAQDMQEPASVEDAPTDTESNSAEPADTEPDSAKLAGSTPAAEYGNAAAESAGSERGDLANALPDSAPSLSDAAAPLRQAMELAVERICGESGYTLETEYVFYLSGLFPYCDFRLLDGETPIEQGRVSYTGLSPNEQFYCFAWTWEGQKEEDASLYRYAVSTDLQDVIWAGESLDTSGFEAALNN